MPTRPTFLGTQALAATGGPLASVAAYDVLRDGGNAVDAAIAAAAVLAVVQPEMCGLGGDAFLLIYSGAQEEAVALNGSGAAPRALRPMGSVPRTGPTSVTVPGAVAAWVDALACMGSRGLADLLGPAIRLADEGFPVSEHVARALAESESVLRVRPETAAVYLPDGRPPRFGERLRLPQLAQTLRQIGQCGAQDFSCGELADRIAAGTRAAGGALDVDDLAAHASELGAPLRAFYRGRAVLVQPPVSQGAVALDELALVADDDLSGPPPGSADQVHLMVEACRLAFEDRDRFLGDPLQVAVDLSTMLDPQRAARRRASIDPERAGPPPAAPSRARPGGTSYLCVIDRDGNAVSLIQSLFGNFGSGVLAGDTGVLLNNRVGGFSADAGSPNALAPGRRPVHTLNNCLVLSKGQGGRFELEYVLGTPGTDAQVQTLFQLLVDLLDRGLGVQDAIEVPRWRREGDGRLLVESRFAPDLLTDLERRGHRLTRGGAWEPRTGGAQAIYRDRTTGLLHGGADPRREGYALGR